MGLNNSFEIKTEKDGKTNRSTFALDTRIIYIRELIESAPIRVTAQLIAYDSKRVHVCLELSHGLEGWISALSEWVLVHVDLGARRSESMPKKTLAILGEIMAAHEKLPRHDALVKPFGLARPS